MHHPISGINSQIQSKPVLKLFIVANLELIKVFLYQNN